MRAVFLLVVITLTASPVVAQQPFDSLAQDRPFDSLAQDRQAPIRASIEKAADAAAAETAAESKSSRESAQRSRLFWSGLAVGIAGVTSSALGLTAFRTEDSSSGNAPSGAYGACVALKNSDPIYATNQCGALKGKNLKLLWGGVALSGVGAALMIGGRNTSAELSRGAIGVFHRWHF